MGRIRRRTSAINGRDRIRIAAALSLSLLVAACSSSGGPGTTAATTPSAAPAPPAAAPPPAAAASPSLKDKIANFFSGSSAKSPQPVANAEPDFNCPYIEIRAGASTLTIPPPPPDGENSAMALKYQGTFVRGARECSVVAGQMVMRVGVEGRIIVGPAGGPGEVDVPLRIAVVEELTGVSKTIVTKLIRIPVTVALANQNPTFTHIEEGLSFPMPSAAALDHYIVYIGFDPIGAAEQERPQPKPARNAKPKPQASAN